MRNHGTAIFIAVGVAFVIDLILGDPRTIPHPVVMIGRLISFLEKILRRLFPKTSGGEYAAGILLLILTIAISTGVPVLILSGLGKLLELMGLPKILAGILEIFWCWQLLAAKSLKEAALAVYEKIKEGDLAASRKALSMIVGRDTEELSMTEVIKAVIETVAENTSDGVIAPLMYMLIGGAPLGFFYKAVNTLDSMVGYKNEKYLYFGRASAKADDILNYIPARLTGLLICLAAERTDEISGEEDVPQMSGKRAFAIFRRDRRKHLSPNSGSPEAAVAGALGIQLGGDACYFGKLVEKETLGDDLREPIPDDILRTCNLMIWSSVYGIVIMGALRLLVGIWI